MKSSSRRLLFSMVTMIVCIAMLVGSTFAWFTDTSKSANNVIKPGRLDLDVKYTLDGENWHDLNGAENLFGDGLFEPGYTRVVAFKVRNNGSLAFKYKMSLDIISEKLGVNVAGENFALSDYLVASTAPAQEWTEGNQIGQMLRLAFDADLHNSIAWTDSNIRELSFGAEDVVLTHGQEVVSMIKVCMPTDIGNVANSKDDNSTPELILGVTVVATQATVEEDSYGPKYDKDATYPVTTAADLQSIVRDATQHVNIVLSGDITTDNFVIPAGKDVTLDLNGHTVSNANAHTILNNGHLTLKDSSADKSGKVVSLKANTAALRNGDNAVCVIEGGTFSRDGANGNTWHVVENFGQMTFNGGKVVLKNGNGFAITNGWNYFDPGATTTHAKMTINALEIDTDSSGIKNCRYGDLTVGDVNVNCTGYWALSNDFLGTAVINGGSFKSASFKAVSNGADMTVNGGTFDGTAGLFIQSYATSTVLNGGTFTNMEKDALSAYVGEGHTAEQSGTSVIIK